MHSARKIKERRDQLLLNSGGKLVGSFQLMLLVALVVVLVVVVAVELILPSERSIYPS